MLKNNFLFTISNLFLIIVCSKAYAWKCIPARSPACELKVSDIVVVAEVINETHPKTSTCDNETISLTENKDLVIYSLKVIKKIKGSIDRELKVHSNNKHAAGRNLEIGEKYLLYLSFNKEGDLPITGCSKVASDNQIQKDLEQLSNINSPETAESCSP